MKEQDIRPQGVFQEYLRLSRLDALTWFGVGERTTVPCPGYGSDQFDPAFEKYGFVREVRFCLCALPTLRDVVSEPPTCAGSVCRFLFTVSVIRLLVRYFFSDRCRKSPGENFSAAGSTHQ